MEENEVVVVETEVEAPKKQKPKTAVRSLEELHEAAIKTMSETEVKKYIEYLRGTLTASEVKAEQLNATLDMAFAKARLLEQQLDTYKGHAQQKLLYVQRAVSNLNDAIRLIGIQEEK